MAVQTMRIPTVFTAIDKFSDVVSKMSMRASAFGKTTEAAAMRASRKFNAVGNSMLTTGVAIATGIGYAVNEAAKFEDRIANIGTLIPELNSLELKGVGDKLLEFSKKTSKPIDEITTSFYDLISAGVKLNDAYPLIKSIDDLSIAGLGSLTEATDIQLAAMRNFKTSFKDSDDAANVLFKTVKYGVTTVQKLSEAYSANAGYAGQLGVTGQEFSAGIVGLTAAKMPTSQAEVALGSISLQIGKTTEKRNKILYSIFKRLGVTKGDQLLKKTGGFLPAIAAISKEAKKAGINMQSVFGDKRAGIAFINLSNNVDVIKAYNTSLQDLNDKSNEAISVAKKLKEGTASFKIGQLKNSMLGLAITIGETLLPRIKDLVDSIIPTIKSFTLWSEENKGFANTLMTVVKWTLILGVSAKILAFAFRTYAFYLKIVNTLIEAYTFVSTMAALSGVSFGRALLNIVKVLGQYALATAATTIATAAMATGIVGGIGVIGFGLYKLIDGFRNMQFKQDYALRQVSVSWINTTNTISNEIAKQKKLIEDMQNPNTNKGYDASRIYDLTPNTTAAKQKIDYLSKFKNKSELEQQQILLEYNRTHTPAETKFRLLKDTPDATRQNLAGRQDKDFNAFLQLYQESKGELLVNVQVDGGTVTSFDNSNTQGLPVVVTSSKTPAKKPF